MTRAGSPSNFCRYCLLATVALAVIPADRAWSNPLRLSVGLDERFSDNVTFQPHDPKSDLEDRAIVTLDQNTGPGTCGSDLNADVRFSHYQHHTYSDQTALNGDWNGYCNLTHSLQWKAQDHVSQQTVNTALASTPNNQTRRNFLSTGPQYQWRIDPRDQLLTSAEYQKTNYSGHSSSYQTNARHYVGSSTYSHQVDPTLSVGVQANVDKGTLDDGEDLLKRGGNLQFQKSFATTSLAGNIGYSELSDSYQGNTTHYPGLVWNLRLDRQLTETRKWYAEYGRQLTDTTSPTVVLQVAGLVFNLAKTSAVEVVHWQTGLNQVFSDGGTLNFKLRRQDTQYLQLGYTEQSTSSTVSFSQPLLTHLTGSVDLGASHDTYPERSLMENTYRGELGLEYRRTRQLSFRLRLGRNQRAANIDNDSYKEDWVLVGVNYAFR